MAKQSKKGKNELDVILEQLKRSYSSDSSDALEDELLEVPENEDDAELNEILNSLFASDQNESATEDEFIENEEFGFTQNESVEDENNESDDTEAALTEEVSNLEEKATQEELSYNIDESAETDTEEDVTESLTEEADASETVPNIDIEASAQVDDVISAMLGYTINETTESEIEDSSPEYTIEENNESPITEDGFFYIDEDSEDYINVDDLDMMSDSDDEKAIDYEFTLIDGNVENDLDVEDFAVEDEEYDTSDISDYNDEESVYVSEESNEEEINEEDVAVEDDVNDIIDVIPKPKLVLSPDEYYLDPLQNLFPTFTLQDREDEQLSPAIPEPIMDYNQNNGFDNNDISLLLKLGYEGEIKAKVGSSKAQEVLLEKDKEYTPNKYQKPYGYCGFELSDRNQVPQITEKYKSNKITSVILLAVVFVFAMLILSVDIYFALFSERYEFFPIALIIEFFCILPTCLILYNKFIFGFMGIIKFEPNRSSLFSFLVIYYTIYQIVSLALFMGLSDEPKDYELVLFGAGIILYAVVELTADLVTCIKESQTFSIIADNKKIYVAEKLSSSSVKNSVNHNKEKNTYRLKESDLISGYFKKSSDKTISRSSLIFFIGIVPIISLICGGAVALCSESIMLGLTFVMLTTLLAIPIGSIGIQPITDFITSKWLKKHQAAFVGSDSIYELSETECLIFSDIDTVEITGCTEIMPVNDSKSEEIINIAYEIFQALGGPLADICRGKYTATGNSNIIINEITDNGVNIYYNNSINILLGDKYFMNTHKIKVKTNTNLSVAVKGVDRSVIYMAFDGVPKLGFILNSKIKKSFIKISELLDAESIKPMLETYEPQINDVYFEQNKPHTMPAISVSKLSSYEPIADNTITNSYVFSSKDRTSVAHAIIMSKKIVKIMKTNKLINMFVSISGIVSAAIFTLISCLNYVSMDASLLLDNIALVTTALIFAEAIPYIVKVILLLRYNKNKEVKTETQNNNE